MEKAANYSDFKLCPGRWLIIKQRTKRTGISAAQEVPRKVRFTKKVTKNRGGVELLKYSQSFVEEMARQAIEIALKI